jgi:eukaryotic-like serine/threonine-protein kinase
MAGQIIGDRWKLLREIGRGGMGVVYEAQNTSIGKRVAIKFIEAEMASDAEVVLRFRREAQAASAIESAHIVHIFDTGTTEQGQPYMVMELLRGESLGDRLRRLERLSPVEAVHIVGQTLRGLMRAHEAGVIHRDLKPDNIFLDDHDDDPLFAKVLDFGISKFSNQGADVGKRTLTRKGVVLGTPFYMSPEQAQAESDIDCRTDLFSVGAILYECLLGSPPHGKTKSYEATIVAICTKDAPRVDEIDDSIPEGLADVVCKALCREREGRFQTAEEFLDALQQAVPQVSSKREYLESILPISSKRSRPKSGQGVQIGVPATGTSWTKLDKMAQSPTIKADTPLPTAPAAKTHRNWLMMGGSLIGIIAFGLTVFVMRPASNKKSVARPLTMTSAVARRIRVRLRTEPEQAKVYLNGKRYQQSAVYGPAWSVQKIRVIAPNYVPFDEDVTLDPNHEIRIELKPEVSLSTTSNTAPPASSPSNDPPSPPDPKTTSNRKKQGNVGATLPPHPPPPSTGPIGLKLKPEP